MTMSLTRVTKVEAARILGVSARTINRRIASGDLQTEREDHGKRRVLVLLDAETLEQAETKIDDDLEVVQLRERVAGLQDLVDHLHDQLDFERARYSELYHDVKTGALALPAPNSDRPWWKLWLLLPD